MSIYITVKPMSHPEHHPDQSFTPPSAEGWHFSQQLPNPISPQNPDPQATLKAVSSLRRKYGPDNVMVGQGYTDAGELSDDSMAIHLRNGVSPRGVLRQIGAMIMRR